MSRIGRKPIIIIEGVEVKIDGQHIQVRGPKGILERDFPDEIKAEIKDGQVITSIAKRTSQANALWGLSRSLLANDITGVSEGFQKQLELVGVGYRARMDGVNLILEVGFSHEVKIQPDEGIEFQVPENNRIIIMSMRKDRVGQVAHMIRKVRPPEPYKGKGIRYAGEEVRQKEGKKVAAGT